MKAYLKEQPFVEKRRIEKISSLEWDFKKKIFREITILMILLFPK